ncbi:MAG: integration host factor subunit alpha [Alphaproteobacteria bacterium]
MKTITRADIADNIYREVGLSRKDSEEILDTTINQIIDTLSAGSDVKLSSFGTFSLRDKSQRIGRNPKTKEEAIISPRRVVTFKPSNTMKEIINKKK